MTRLYFFTNSECRVYCQIYKSQERISIFKIISYALDKEDFLKRNYFLERCADRFGLLSPIMSQKEIINLIIKDGIKIVNIKILFFDFTLGRDFFQRFFIALILLIKPSVLTLKVYLNDSKEKYKNINLINSNITD